jgi:hypothetical protein
MMRDKLMSKLLGEVQVTVRMAVVGTEFIIKLKD